MIRHIRDIAGDLQSLNAPPEQDVDLDDDPGLDLLLKHAVRSNWLEHDPRAVWERLSERVMGPFGKMAVEGPALMGDSTPLPQPEPATNTNNRHSDARRNLLRLDDVAFNVR